MRKLSLVLAAVFTLMATGIAAAQQSNYLFILDASGSMWGRIEADTPKISVARDVLGELMGKLPHDAATGLMAYGHRRKGDCADIEMLSSIGERPATGLANVIETISPRGKTPLAGAVERAVEALRTREERTRIVLISDGLESCGGDPCRAVQAANAAGLDFELHVVGFDLAEADTSALQCMARAGGGRYFAAASRAELADALTEAVEAEPAPPQPQPARLVLSVTANGAPIEARAYVHEAGREREVDRARLGTSPQDHYPNPSSFELAPGSYEVRVRPMGITADARWLENIEIAAGETLERKVDFSEGTLRLAVTANGRPVEARTYVYEVGTENEVTRASVGTGPEDHYPNPASYRLPPGKYDVWVWLSDHLQAWARGVQVKAGEETREGVDLTFGRLSLEVVADGAPVEARTYVYEAGTQKEVTRASVGSGPDAHYPNPATYRLVPGEYDVWVWISDAWQKTVRGLDVQEGETSRVRVDMSDVAPEDES